MSRIKGRRQGSRRKDSGYMLLLLMLAAAVLTIMLLGVAQNYRRGIQRDREVEMIHRGEQYARAVKRYYHKFGRYPTSIEQLENTNNLRFLRKKYKDPMSADGEWKLAHEADIKIKVAGASSAAAGTVNGAATDQSNPGDTGAASNRPNQSTDGTSIGSATTGAATGTNTNNLTQGAGASGSIGGTGTNGNAANPVLGGGALLGVVSKQKTEGIHAFGDKTKYNEWFFIYVQSQDVKGRLLVGPYNPNMFVGAANSGLTNTNTKGTSGIGTSGPTANPNPGSAITPPTTMP